MPLLLAFTCIGLVLSLRSAGGTSLETAPDEQWAKPTVLAMNNLGPGYATDDLEGQRNYACTPLSYRLIDDLSKTMHTGCFVSAAFGMVDPDLDVAIFNGTDEAEPIRMDGTTPALSVLPDSATVARFGGFPIEGTYMYLYDYFPNALSDSRDILLHRYKTLNQATDMTVTDPTGQPLAVNPEAFAYSARGQWMVTESPGHALVRVNLATFSELPFAPSFQIAAQPSASHSASMAITEDGRYVAVVSNEFASFKVYDLSTCAVTESTNDSLAPESCKSYNYWPYVSSQATSAIKGISHVHFVNDGLLSFDATDQTGSTSYELSPSGPITSLISYLGVGDSYASGQGAGNYLTGTDTAVNSCHVSSHSYPLLLNADVFAGAGHTVACSGATIQDIVNTSPNYTGQTTDQRSAKSRESDGSDVAIIHDFTPGYLSQQTFIEAYQPGVITVEIGGNDVGFKDMLVNCTSPIASLGKPQLNPNDCYASYEDRLEVEQTIDRQYQKWVALFRQLHHTAPASRVYAIGYPQIVDSGGSCGLNVHLSPGDIDFTHSVITYIDSAIDKAAMAAGVHYVDISNALQGHELCDAAGGEPGMNGLTAGSDVYGLLSKESYHPTAFGQELIEQSILHGTDHFAVTPQPIADPTVPIPTPDDNDALLQAPKTGRTTKTIIPDDNATADSVVRGSTIAVHISSNDINLPANASYSVQLSGGTILGTVHSAEDGSISASVTVPPDTAPGSQPITITGPGQSGDPVTITKPIDVDNSSQDYDGDGIPNSQDSCPTVINSGVDADHDGIDDACDTDIQPSNSSGMPPSNTASSDSDLPISTPNGTGQSTDAGNNASTATSQPAASDDSAGIQSTLLAAAGVQGNDLGMQAPPQQLIVVAASVSASGRNDGVITKLAASSTHLLSTDPKLSVGQPVASRLQPILGRSHLSHRPLKRFGWYLWLLLFAVIAALCCGCNYILDKKQRRRINYRRLMYS